MSRSSLRLGRRVRAASATAWGKTMAWMLVARVLVMATVIATAWLADPTDAGLAVLVQVALGIWLPSAILVAWRRLRGEDLVRRAAAVAVDLALSLAAIVLVPNTGNAVLAFMVVVIAAEARSAQFLPALSVSVPAVAVAVGAHVINPTQVSLAMLLTFCASAVALPIVLVQFRGRHQEQRRQMSRLYRSLSAVEDPADLDATVEVIARAAQQALGADVVEIDTAMDGEDAAFLALLAEDGPVVTPTEVAVPLRAGEEIVATMVARVPPDERLITPDDIEVLNDLAEVSGLALLRARALDSARAAAEQQRASEQLHGELMSSMTHELRAPLTTIRGFIETLLHHDDNLSDEQRNHMLEGAHRNATTLSHRISEILEFSRLAAERVTVEPTRQPLRQVIDRIVAEAAGMLTRHKVSVQVPDRIWAMVDEIALGHVLTNLLSNSAKYSDAGSLIVIGARFDDDMVLVSVTDHGRGIASEDTERVFGRYERAAGDFDGIPQPGSGIGLTVVRRYVEMGGGRAWIDSVEGVGTTVSFTVPRGDTVPPWESNGSWLQRLPARDDEASLFAEG